MLKQVIRILPRCWACWRVRHRAPWRRGRRRARTWWTSCGGHLAGGTKSRGANPPSTRRPADRRRHLVQPQTTTTLIRRRRYRRGSSSAAGASSPVVRTAKFLKNYIFIYNLIACKEISISIPAYYCSLLRMTSFEILFSTNPRLLSPVIENDVIRDSV